MKGIAVLSVIWIGVFILGLAGIFSNQVGMVAICMLSWTPIAISWGWLIGSSGLHVTVGQTRVADRKREIPVELSGNRDSRLAGRMKNG